MSDFELKAYVTNLGKYNEGELDSIPDEYRLSVSGEEEQRDELTVLVVEPMKEPYVKTIPSGLASLQAEVAGDIEAVYPYADPVALIVNEEGKINGLPLNRGLYDDEGNLYDIMAGTFLVTGLTEDNFGSLSMELVDKYTEQFRTPEMFVQINGKITVIPAAKEGRDEAMQLAAEIVDSFDKCGLDGFYEESKELLAQKAEMMGMMLASGNDFLPRSMLLDIANSRSEASMPAIALLKKLDAYYEKLDMPRFLLFQLEHGSQTGRNLSFLSYDQLQKMGQSLDGRNYTCVYSGKLKPGETLDSIYERFNLQHPADFRGHSLSVSDVIVIHQNGQDQAHYVDSFGFRQVPEFFAHNPLEKVEELLEDDYGMIDGIINNGDRRKEQEPEKKPSVREKLQEKKAEAAQMEQAAPKPKKEKIQDVDLS